MVLNIDTKFEGKLTCAFKNHQSTFESLKIWLLLGFFFPKYKMDERKIYRGVMYLEM